MTVRRRSRGRTTLGRAAVAVLAGVVVACSAGTEPTVPAGGADLTLYVRNQRDEQAWISILLGPDGGAAKDIGFGNTVGISCNVIPAGSRVLLMDGLPTGGTPAAVVAEVFEANGGEARPVRWLDIAPDGASSVGEGVPGWWSGPPSC
ncbi:MAG: hypothetical protein AB1627_08305 [Chloroflexota bacterium]